MSTEPVTRTDVIKLGEQLDLRLQERQARVVGICPVRRELFTQCFGKTPLYTDGILKFRMRTNVQKNCLLKLWRLFPLQVPTENITDGTALQNKGGWDAGAMDFGVTWYEIPTLRVPDFLS